MSLLVAVLASGSGGNATLLVTTKTRVLIDAGIGPHVLAERLHSMGTDYSELDAVLLTHLHHDHVRPPTLLPLVKHQVNLCCHKNHVRPLARRGDQAKELAKAGLLWAFEDKPFRIGEIEVQPLDLPHDDEGGSFGFCFSIANGSKDCRMGYLTDLGHVPARHEECLCDLDIVALEHNHDLKLLTTSRRPERLKSRIRGRYGHLSNGQAATTLWNLLERSTRAPAHLFLMHLSRECNTPELPMKKSGEVLAAFGAKTEIHVTFQNQPTRPVILNGEC